MSGKILKVLHKFAITVCAAQLTLYTSPLMAQPVRGSGNIVNEDVSTMSQIGMAALDIVNTGAQTYLQARQQSFAALQQVSLMQQLAPRTQFDKYFGCPIPESDSAFIQNACENPDPSQIGTYMALQSIADGYEDYYKRLSNPAQNTRTPIGLQCLEDSKTRALNGMEAKLKQMQELRAQLKKSQQQFRDDQQQLLSEMGDLNDELKGRKGTKAGDDTNTFRNEIGDDCSNILGNLKPAINIDTAHTNGGFIGMLQGMQKPNLDAANFARDKGAIEKEINDVINQIKSDIANDGIDNWGGNGSTQAAYFNKLLRGKENIGGVLNTVITSEQSILERNLKVLVDDIKAADPSFRLPKRDKNFAVNMEKFIAGAEDHYKREEVRKCVTGEKYGLGLSSRDILGSLYVPTSKNRETQTLRDYRDALSGILNDKNITIEQREAEIRALDKKYGGAVKMRFNDNQSVKQENVTAYDYFQGYIKDCEAKFYEDNTHGPNGGGIGQDSEATKVSRAVASLRKMKNEIDKFSENIGAQIDAQLNNCNGAKLKADKCGPDTISVEGPNFCIPHATQCSAKINACFKKVQDGVQQRQDDLNNKANSFNDRMENYVANQEQILQQIRGVVSSQEEFLTGFFESDAVDLHIEDLFIPMPKMSDENEFGLKLRGNGTLDVMKEMDKKLELVQSQIKRQKKQLEGKLDEHINGVGNQLAENQAKWRELKGRCKGVEEAIRQATDEQNAEGAAKQAEIDNKVGTFCSRFDRLTQVNPGPGCNGDDSPEALFGDMHEVAGQIDPRVRRYLFQYQNLCSSVNSEADSDDATGNSSKAPLLQACERSGYKWNKAFAKIGQNFMDKVDRAGFEDSDYKAIKEYIEEGGEFPEDDLSKDFNESEFADIALQINEMRNPDLNAPLSESQQFAANRRKAFDDQYNAITSKLSTALGKFPSSPNEYTSSFASSAAPSFKFNGGSDIKSMSDLVSLLSDRSKFSADGVTRANLVTLQGQADELIKKRLEEVQANKAGLTIKASDNLLTDANQLDAINKYIKGEGPLPAGFKMKNPNGTDKTEAEAKAFLDDKKAKYVAANKAEEGIKDIQSAIGGNKIASLDPTDVRAPDVNRNVANNGNGDICETLSSNIDAANDGFEKDCDGKSDESSCLSRKQKGLEKSLLGVENSSLRRYNSSLETLEAVAFDDSAERWRNIGEQASGICKSRSTASRNGLINQDVLNQMIGGGAPQPLNRNGFGVQ